jgi:hypothetical protein
MRRTWLLGCASVHKRHLMHVAGYNLALIIRRRSGRGTPREAVAARHAPIAIVV